LKALVGQYVFETPLDWSPLLRTLYTLTVRYENTRKDI